MSKHKGVEKRKSSLKKKPAAVHAQESKIPFWVIPTTYISYAIPFSFGKMRDFFGRFLYPEHFRDLNEHDVKNLFFHPFLVRGSDLHLLHPLSLSLSLSLFVK